MGIFALRRAPRKKRKKIYTLTKTPHSFFNRRTSVNFCHPQDLKIFLPRQNPKNFFAARIARKNFFIALNLGISLHCAQFVENSISLTPCQKNFRRIEIKNRGENPDSKRPNFAAVFTVALHGAAAQINKTLQIQP